MPITISLTSTDVFTALRAFLVAVLPTGTEIVQAQDNGVPMPKGSFVAMNNAGIKRLATNVDSGTPGTSNPGGWSITTPTQFTMALDFYGSNASAMAMTVQAMFRDEAGVALFPATVQPLYCDDPIQLPLITAEEQWLERWRVSAVMQIDPTVSTTQDFATALDIGLKEVDTTFPPQ
jgi:hypothetical protein